jgi:hypothetical protein
VLNGFNTNKIVVKTSKPEESHPPPPPPPPVAAEVSTIKIPKSTENMDLATQKLYKGEKLKVNDLLDSIRTEKDRTKKIILNMELLEILYHFIVQYGNYNSLLIERCKKLTRYYIGTYELIRDYIIDYCLEQGKISELLTFENNYKELKNLP